YWDTGAPPTVNRRLPSMSSLYVSYDELPTVLLHIHHTPADRVSAPPGGSLLGGGFVGPSRPPFFLLGFFDTFLPPAYALCQPQIADLASFTVPFKSTSLHVKSCVVWRLIPMK